MKCSTAIIWIAANMTSVGIVWLATDDVGWSLYLLPLFTGYSQAFILRRHVRPVGWIAASLLGLFISGVFIWFFFAAIGLCMSAAQCIFFKKPPRGTRALWVACGAAGWLIGLLAANLLDFNNGQAMFPVIFLLYSTALLIPLARLERHSSNLTPAADAHLETIRP